MAVRTVHFQRTIEKISKQGTGAAIHIPQATFIAINVHESRGSQTFVEKRRNDDRIETLIRVMMTM